ncbi:F-box protein skip23 [Thalictrum thalictroides]|uniref:F-box protein skip23 n=1 Tax=Thalictrum thalictroides TaxID=46969 RepID=A0A7J6WSX3_THATH|nr:F-box protein skip23 [Thalictrum thalictroides]
MDQNPSPVKKRNGNSIVNWLELPDHVVSLISNKLIQIKDYIQFGSVCQPWHSIYTENRHHISQQLPFLMITTELNLSDEKTRSFYNVVEKKILNFKVRVHQNRIIVGSSHGWLVSIFRGNKRFISLLNPFLSVNNQIRLPYVRSKNFTDYDILAKVVLSKNPSSNPNDFIAMAILGPSHCQLACFKAGDKAWTYLPEKYCLMMDVLYYKDQFYCVNQFGKVFAFDLNDHHNPKITTVSPEIDHNTAGNRFLVESYGELLQVCRLFRTELIGWNCRFVREYFYGGFHVFKLDPVGFKWIKMDNLEGRALFVGGNASISVLASDFPGCKPNSVYLNDDYYEKTEQDGIRPHDIAVYSLVDDAIERHSPIGSKHRIQRTIWIEPTL